MTSKQMVVGILTVPLSPTKKYFKVCGDGYIASSHIDWLERCGFKILAIPYDTLKHTYYFDNINALYLPSGGAFASTQEEYYNCCKTFINLAMKSNNLGKYFPIWGGCMGMQQMMIMADGFDDLNFLENFDSFKNLMLPLNISPKSHTESRIMKYLNNTNKEFVNKLEKTKCTLNNHMLGLTPDKFYKSKQLSSLYRIVSTNEDRGGKTFVSTIEGRRYPFYGVQWHPERGNDMDHLAKYFYSESKKNTNVCSILDEQKLQFKKVDCMVYSGELYNHCNFYWHTKTSEHNKELCTILNLGKPTNNAI